MEIDGEPAKYFGVVRRDPPEDPERVILDHYYRASTLASAFGVAATALRELNPAVSDSVWSGRRLLPRGYELRVPRDPLRAAPKVVLASIGSSERLDAPVREYAGTHRVKRGETLSRIAAKYGVSTRALQRENGLRSANRIRVGQRLKIPGEPPPPLPAASPAPATQIAGRAPEPAPAEGVYRVRRGDTLAGVARKFGVSAKDLATVNHIRNANQIHPGQVLELPGGSLTARPEDRSHAGTYVVRRGDSLDAIARKFGVSVQELTSHNGIRNKNQIKVGQSIYIPGPPEPPAVQNIAAAPAETAPVAQAPAAAPAPSLAVTSLVVTPAVATVSPEPAGRGAAPAPIVDTAPSPATPPPIVAPPPLAQYVVRRGDTLTRISEHTGVTERELIALNRIRNKNRLSVGQTLKLPAPPEPSAPPPSEASPAVTEEPPAASASGR